MPVVPILVGLMIYAAIMISKAIAKRTRGTHTAPRNLPPAPAPRSAPGRIPPSPNGGHNG